MDSAGNISREGGCKVLVVGVGGGGCTVLSHAMEDWPNPPPMAAVNTDMAALAGVRMDLKVVIGKTIAQGMGAGGDAELGRLAANEDLDALRSLVAGHDLLLLVATLGRGAATGAAPVIAQIAQEQGLLVLAYVTTPFNFEGSRFQEQAQEGLAKLKEHADTVICLPNQRLYDMLEAGTPLKESFALVDRIMAAGIRGLWTLLTQDNTLNLDFSDLQSLVANSGNECAFGYGEGQGPDKARQALEQLLDGPMMNRGQVIANSGAMILSIIGGPDLSLSELELIRQRFQDATRPGAHTAVGAAVLDDWTGRLALTVLAAEHWMPATDANRGRSTFTKSFFESEPGTDGRGKQGVMDLGTDRGRFKDMAPTTYKGEDLDIPTYIRRHVRLPG